MFSGVLIKLRWDVNAELGCHESSFAFWGKKFIELLNVHHRESSPAIAIVLKDLKSKVSR
jgi:hypothetical protein